MKTFLRRFFWTLGTLAVLIFLFHFVETWRGRRAWAQWKRAQEAVGINYDPAAYAPKAIPDAENFAAVPFVSDAVTGKAQLISGQLSGVFTNPPTVGDWRVCRTADYAAFAKELGPRSMEDYLQPFETRLAELDEALRRPSCRFKVDYLDSNQIPALLSFRQYIRIIRVRALSRLQAGRSEQALEDVLDGLRMAQHLQREPHLTSQLLRMACTSLILQPVWEGLRAHAWNEGQLARLEAALAPVDLIASAKLGWRYERIAFGVVLLKDVGRVEWADPDGKPEGRIRRWARRGFIPQGWIYQGMATRDRVFAEGIEGALDPGAHRVHPEAPIRGKAIVDSLAWPLRAMAVVPALLTQNQRVARIQTGVDHARVACALERYRLAKGGYPDDLNALAPAFLSHVPWDLITGEPLRYLRTGRGFKLYSVGWDGKDDGGRLGPNSADGNPLLDQGDWLWSTGD